MGKFSTGMKKYGKTLSASFSLDKEKRKQVPKENKLNHAEKLMLTPVSMITGPLILIPMGLGMTVAGLVVTPISLASKILFGEGGTVAAMGGGLIVGGVVLTGIGAVSPVIDVACIPYNSYKAIKHRHKHKNDSMNPLEGANEELPSSSHVKVREILVEENVQNLAATQPVSVPVPPSHTTQLFSEITAVQVQEEIQPAVNNVVNL
ncbi:Uncharacterised protein [Legionella beliardensis]|uniref:Uncharacterized protein n=1 Tax=Legionella beliardensis TaxID=91822 RepID=A0A378I520_9GAMM|nr:hypothetical protein [Legionella beliardensis]STX30113.1 Uncharacterised protein [Legionella beliardensis]